ncbi:hypothetical protein ACHAPE_000536 [Trichoderma viride]
MAQNGVVEEHLRQFQNWGTWGSEAVKFGILLAPHLKDTTPDTLGRLTSIVGSYQAYLKTDGQRIQCPYTKRCAFLSTLVLSYPPDKRLPEIFEDGYGTAALLHTRMVNLRNERLKEGNLVRKA